MSLWPYQECPHIHAKNNRSAQLSQIPYTIFPNSSINAFTTLPIKSANLSKSNVPTVAYQNYTNTNFCKDYYYNNNNTTADVTNTIVEELREQMQTRSAYVLAGVETQNYAKFKKQQDHNIENARRRAVAHYNQYFNTEQNNAKMNRQENSKWLQRLYRKLTEIARHIIQGQGELLDEKQKKLLMSKLHLNAQFISKIKVRDPKVACEVAEQLRILMLKKKKSFDAQRQEQQNDVSVSMSFGSQSGSNTSQNSMLSEATSLNESKGFGEEAVVGKYCDFQALKKKWRCEDVEEVKQIIRRVLTNQILSNAEVQAVRRRVQSAKINQGLLKSQTQTRTNTPKTGRSSKKVKPKNPVTKTSQVLNPKTSLTIPEQSLKQSLIKGGQYDAAGEKFERTRNYSLMFKKKEQQNLVDFQLREKASSFLDCTRC